MLGEGIFGTVFSSSPSNDSNATELRFRDDNGSASGIDIGELHTKYRAFGQSVRCIKD